MPLIRVEHATAQSVEDKRKLISAMTDAYASSTGTDPAKVWVVLDEVPRTDWGTGGKTLSDRDAGA
ncbi:MAG: 4-oxalocrotonate tautomerase [Streptosporangiales bacterium]|nr:4-oxalocrotonate tautomerase [Streptosporangiales bacterium]